MPAIRRVSLRINGHCISADIHMPREDRRAPIVFFHGVLSSTSIASELFVDPSNESWISFSLPGHFPGVWILPNRPAALGQADIGFLYEQALCELIGKQSVIMAGWSTGGFMAMNHALCYPRRVRAVASLAGFSSGKHVTDLMSWLIWLSRFRLGSLAMKKGIQVTAVWPPIYSLLLRFFTSDRNAATQIPPAITAEMYRGFTKHDPTALTLFLSALPSLDITEHVHEINAPTWIAAGDRDPVVPYSEAVELSKLIAGSHLQTYPHAGHLFFSEWPTFQTDFAQWRKDL